MNTLETNLTAAHAEVKSEIARTDNKTGLLLAFTGAALAGVWTVAKDTRIPQVAYAAGVIGVGLLLAAIALLLGSVRPNLGGARPGIRLGGFPLWATLTPDEVAAELAVDSRAEDIARLSRIALTKFARLQRAVDLVRAGGVFLLVAALLTLGGVA